MASSSAALLLLALLSAAGAQTNFPVNGATCTLNCNCAGACRSKGTSKCSPCNRATGVYCSRCNKDGYCWGSRKCETACGFDATADATYCVCYCPRNPTPAMANAICAIRPWLPGLLPPPAATPGPAAGRR